MNSPLRNPKCIQLVKRLLIVCWCFLLTSCAHVDKYSFERIGSRSGQFQSGSFESSIREYQEAIQQRDRNYALWNNQLGSIYLAQGEYDKALDALLKAHYLMNNVPAFKELERKATSLTGSEDKKAYKGDPYEKAMNALYVGLLLYNTGDLENAMAAFKTGILADSDSTGEAYKSDIAVLHLLVARIAKKLGYASLSNDYQNVVKELCNNSNYSYLGCSDEVIQAMLNLKNNVLLVVDFGEGPYKSRTGKYGELAKVYGDRYGINGFNIKLDVSVKAENQVYSNTDVYFQANTRGGRKMDGILKGKAQFKTNTANTSVAMLGASQDFINQGNAARAANPYADTSGYAAAAGISMLVAGISGIFSSATNPKADIRCWALLPEHIIVFPLALTPAKHKINIEFIDGRSLHANNNIDYAFEVDIKKDKDNIIFKRVLDYQMVTHPAVSPSGVTRLSEKTKTSDVLFFKLIDKGKDYSSVELLLGPPHEKRKDLWGREIWLYPSDKPGFSNCVYFVKGRVSELENKQVANVRY